MNRSEIYYLFQFEIKIRINILTNNINKHLKRKEKSSKKEKKKKILLRLPFFMTQLDTNCKRNGAAYSGKVEVDSEYFKGSTFRLYPL